MHVNTCILESIKIWQNKDHVRLYWRGCHGPPTLGRYPTTAQHGCFWLLGFPPRPVHTSLDNLGTPGSPRVTILMPSLVRTPNQHRRTRSRTPHLKPSKAQATE